MYTLEITARGEDWKAPARLYMMPDGRLAACPERGGEVLILNAYKMDYTQAGADVAVEDAPLAWFNGEGKF